MKFLYPGFLWALGAIAIPILIHLFNFRRYKVVFFSNLRFLRNLQEQTQSQQRLKHLLVLLARILAISALVLAFAQPYLPGANQQEGFNRHAISVFIDNSFSMTNQAADGELLEIARNKAREIGRAYKESDQFQLITNDFEGRHQRLVSRKDFLQLVDEVKVSPASKKISEVITRQKQALSKAADAERGLFLISDFQQSQTDLAQLKPDTNYPIRVLPLPPVVLANLYIDSCWFTSPYIQPNEPAVLMARIRNAGDENAEGNSVSLLIDGKQKALAGFEVKAGSYSDVAITFTMTSSGNYAAELVISDHPITFDDKLYLSFTVNKEVNILHIYGEEPNFYLQSVLDSDPYLKTTRTNSKQINYGELGRYQLLVLDGLTNYSSGLQLELSKFIEAGGCAVVFPSASLTLPGAEIASFLNAFGVPFSSQLTRTNESIHQVNTQADLFKTVFEKVPQNLDLPKVNNYYSLGASRSKNSTPLLSMRNGDIVFGAWKTGKGKLYVSGLALDKTWSGLPESWLMSALMLRISYLSQQMPPLYYTIGKEKMAEIAITGTEKEGSYRLKNGNIELIPATAAVNNKLRIYFNDMIRTAGNYTFSAPETSPSSTFSFNYARGESSMQFTDNEKLADFLPGNLSVIRSDGKAISNLLTEQDRGTPFWKLCITLALVFLLIEILLLKFYRT